MATRSEQTKTGLARAAAKGRKPGAPSKVSDEAIMAALHLGTTDGAKAVGLSLAQFRNRRKKLEAP